MMNKSELITAISERTGLEKNKVENFLNAFTEVVTEIVSGGDKVQLVGFGTFEKRHREARAGRNPKTGEPIQIAATDVPAFTAGKLFKDAVSA
ncbi:MAG: HU family DNA-binding protein [Clostridia bacterium]|nr:HU family DNA-binding protein [Clostridia bacterium]